MAAHSAQIVVDGVTLAYGELVVQRDLSFTIDAGDVFIIMGGSGCGKSTVMRSLVGLLEPVGGRILFDGISYWDADPETQAELARRFGVTYQGGALWSSMTLAENVALPLEHYTSLGPRQIREVVRFKLALVGLKGFEDFYPSEISGGMRKRVGVARAIALDPEILFFDEPAAGLDPVSAKLLDDLILALRDSLGTTMVVVTHELASIFTIGTNSVMLDAETKTRIASGNPCRLRDECTDPVVRRFLTRGEG